MTTIYLSAVETDEQRGAGAMSGRSSKESASPILDAIIDQGITAGIEVSDRIRRKIRRDITADTPPGEIMVVVRRILAETEPMLARTVSDAMLAGWFVGGDEVAAKMPRLESSRMESPRLESPRLERSEGESIRPSATGTGLPEPPTAPPTSQSATPPDAPPSEPPAPPAEPPIPPPGRLMLENGGAGDPSIRYPIIDDAAHNLASRRLLRASDYYQATEQARTESFTVARVESERTLEQIRDFLAKGVQDGGPAGTLREFTKFMSEETSLSPAHIENIYRTNVATAYATGMERVLANEWVSSEFPFVMTVPIRDGRLTDLCRIVAASGMSGTSIFARDDPEWQRLKNPRHWQCRCNTRPCTIEDAARAGVVYAQEWLRNGTRPAWSPWVDRVPVELPAGWVQRAG